MKGGTGTRSAPEPVEYEEQHTVRALTSITGNLRLKCPGAGRREGRVHDGCVRELHCHWVRAVTDTNVAISRLRRCSGGHNNQATGQIAALYAKVCMM